MNMINVHLSSGHPVPAVQFQSFVWGSPDSSIESVVVYTDRAEVKSKVFFG